MRYTALEREVEIRKGTEQDPKEQIDDLFHTAHALISDHALHRYSLDGLFGQEKDQPHGELYLAVSEPRLIGGLIFFDPANTKGCPYFDRPDVASIGPFAVVPEFQGHGLGDAMLEMIEARARESGAKELALEIAPEATHALQHFLKQGFRFAETARRQGSSEKSIILSKSLE
jgi:GNAT superfamily N-acetyltransferase